MPGKGGPTVFGQRDTDSMEVFHRTDAGDEILSDGFRDGHGSYMTHNEYSGVWLSNTPLDANEGAEGDQLLAVDIPEDVLTKYEWLEEGKQYREFLVPAEVVNSYGSARLLSEDEEARLLGWE